MIDAIKVKYRIELDQSETSIKKPAKGTSINWPKDPAAITIPKDKVRFCSFTIFPTAPKTTAVPHPAAPKPNIACEAIISKLVFTFAIQKSPIKTRRTPDKDAFPDPYLSDIAPNNGDPIPIKRNWIATAKPNTSRPDCK